MIVGMRVAIAVEAIDSPSVYKRTSLHKEPVYTLTHMYMQLTTTFSTTELIFAMILGEVPRSLSHILCFVFLSSPSTLGSSLFLLSRSYSFSYLARSSPRLSFTRSDSSFSSISFSSPLPSLYLYSLSADLYLIPISSFNLHTLSSFLLHSLSPSHLFHFPIHTLLSSLAFSRLLNPSFSLYDSFCFLQSSLCLGQNLNCFEIHSSFSVSLTPPFFLSFSPSLSHLLTNTLSHSH